MSGLLDIALIVFVAFTFSRPVLNFNDQHTPSQDNDWQDITSSMELARESIVDHHELPMWNPNFATGTPFVGEPKTYLFNPLASVPALIWGVYSGPKISVFLALAFAGIGMHYLAGTLGISRPWRIWAGGMMTISGAFTARIFAGHFEFVMGLALVPWVFGLSLQALRRPGIIFPLLAGAVNAMLFFSGHALYTVYAIPGLALTLVFVAADEALLTPAARRETVLAVVGRGAQIAAWTFGIAAIQFIPVWTDLGNFPAPHYHLEGAETIGGSLNDFWISNPKTVGPDPAYPYWGFWEYYFYVGFVPFVGLGLAAAAILRPALRFALVWALVLFAFYLSWAAAPHTFFKWFYDWFHVLYQFRAPSRALAFATPFLLLLAAVGFSAVTDWFEPHLTIKLRDPAALARFAMAAAVSVGLLIFCLRGFDHVYSTNRSLLGGRARDPDEREVVEYLRAQESGTLFVQAPLLGQAVPPDFYRLGFVRSDARWEYGYRPPEPKPELAADISRTATYLIGATSDPTPPGELVALMDGLRVTRQPNAPPFASTLPSDDRPNGAEYPWDMKATPAAARIVSANVIEVQAASATGDDRIVVMESYHSGWRVEIDGKRSGKPDNFGSFLSVPALPGMHTYTFVFDPSSVRIGAAVTAGTILGALLLLCWRYVQRQRRFRADRPTRL